VRETAWAVVNAEGQIDRSSTGIGCLYLYVSRKKADEASAWFCHPVRLVRVTITEAPARRATAKGRRGWKSAYIESVLPRAATAKGRRKGKR
jgi:hypothetical protein